MTVTVQFGSLAMFGTPQFSDGVYQVEAGFFQDWYTLSDSKEDARERPTQDGAFGIDHDWRTSLPISMTVRFRGASWPVMLAALQAAAGVGAAVSVTVSDQMGVSTRSVSVRTAVPTILPGAQLVSVTINMLALDPHRYGAAVSPSTGLPTTGTGIAFPIVYPLDWGTGGDPGRVTLVNSGTAQAAPLLAVSGGLASGVQLVETTTGSYLELDRVIPLGSTVYFNTRTSRIYLDDPANDVSGFASYRDWSGFLIPAGGTRIVQFNGLGAVTGTPILTATFSPAY